MEKLFLLAIRDLNSACEIQIFQPLIDGYSANGNILRSLQVFNFLLLCQSDGRFDMQTVCGEYALDNGNDRVMKCLRQYNEKYAFPKLNAMCFNVLLKGFTRFKQLRFGRNEVSNDEEFNFLKNLLVPANSWKIIDYV